MKIIKAKGESFEFALDGLTKVYILKEGVSVEDRVADEIVKRYSQLVTVEKAPIEEVIAAIQSEEKAPIEEAVPATPEEPKAGDSTDVVVEKPKADKKKADKKVVDKPKE